MNSLELSGISASSCSDKGRDPVSCIFHTIILPMVAGLAYLSPYTARMSGIRSCVVLPSCRWCTKQLLVFPCSCSGSTEMLNSSNPPSILRWLGPSASTSSLPVARLPAEPLPASETFFFVRDILSVGVVSCQTGVDVAYRS
jgi:hypothetical protein